MEKDNQIVSDSDACYIKKALEGSPDHEHIVDFFDLGAFRIFSGKFL